MSDRVRLPDPTPKPVPPFAPGSLVRLRASLFGAPGRVLRFERGRVYVRWPGLGQGRHRPVALVLAVDADGPQLAQDAPLGARPGKPPGEAKEASNGHQF